MTVAYIVLSHRNPDQVLRLLAALAEGPGAGCSCATTRATRHSTSRRSRRLGARTIRDAIDFEWGGWSQLRLLLACLSCAAEAVDPDWLLVLSGQDYPLRPLASIEADLAAEEHDAMLGHAWELDTARLPEPPDDEFFLRCAYRHYAAPRATPRLPLAVRPLVYLRELPPPLRPRLGVRRAKTPFHAGLECFVSADWLTLDRRALGAVLRAARERSDLMRYYRRVAIPSESFFATVLLNDRSLRVARDNRRFISFEAPLTPHPQTLTSADLDRCWPAAATSPASSTRRSTQKCWTRSTSGERRKSRARLRSDPPAGGLFRAQSAIPTFRGAMARGDVRIAVTLACEECKRRNYQTEKSKRNDPDRIEFRKYCRWCGRHTPHKETR